MSGRQRPGYRGGSQAAFWQDLGEFLVDLSDITNSIAGLNTSVQEILAAPADATPVGTIIMYYSTTAPSDYLPCNGTSFSATTYPRLYALLGKTTTPDMRGYFVRGYGPGGTVDPNAASRAVGLTQGDAMRNITGSASIFSHNADFWATGVFSGSNYTQGGNNGGSRDFDNPQLNFDASRVVPTATENRPKNIALLYCIKHD